MDGRNLQKALEEKLLAGEETESSSQKIEQGESNEENAELSRVLSDTGNKINFTREHLKIFELLSPDERDQLFLSMAATDSLQAKDIDWDKVFQDPEAVAPVKTVYPPGTGIYPENIQFVNLVQGPNFIADLAVRHQSKAGPPPSCHRHAKDKASQRSNAPVGCLYIGGKGDQVDVESSFENERCRIKGSIGGRIRIVYMDRTSEP